MTCTRLKINCETTIEGRNKLFTPLESRKYVVSQVFNENSVISKKETVIYRNISKIKICKFFIFPFPFFAVRKLFKFFKGTAFCTYPPVEFSLLIFLENYTYTDISKK